MDVFDAFLETIEDLEHRARTKEVLEWINNQYPQLTREIKWNQPMFLDHSSFIIAFSIAKKHLALAPEEVCINRFQEEIKEAGYEFTKMLIRLPWNRPVDYSLLAKLIEFNIMDKADCKSFWRK